MTQHDAQWLHHSICPVLKPKLQSCLPSRPSYSETNLSHCPAHNDHKSTCPEHNMTSPKATFPIVMLLAICPASLIQSTVTLNELPAGVGGSSAFQVFGSTQAAVTLATKEPEGECKLILTSEHAPDCLMPP